MFGIIFFIGLIIVGFISKIKICKDNMDWDKEQKQRAIEKGWDSYLNHELCYTDIKTGQAYRIKEDINGNRWRVSYTGKPLVNLTEEKNKKIEDEKKVEAIAKGENWYIESIGRPTYAVPGDFRYLQKKRMNHQIREDLPRYKNVRTGEECFRKICGDAYFYQDLETGKLKYTEINPRCKNNTKVKLYIKPNGGNTIEVDNTPENLKRSMEYMNTVLFWMIGKCARDNGRTIKEELDKESCWWKLGLSDYYYCKGV